MSSPRVITIASQKGGTGKTSTVINLGACLAELNKKVLVIDIDPQANLTSGLGIDRSPPAYSIYDILLNPEIGIKAGIIDTTIEGLQLVPANLNLAGAEVELADKPGREWLLKDALEPVRDNYDYIFIDTPPSLGLFTQNALIACDEVIVPLQVHIFAYKALPQLQQVIKIYQSQNPDLRISGIICTMYDRRNNLSKVVEETIREEMGNVVFQTVIPINVALAEAPGAGLPITGYAPKSIGCKAYRSLADELLKNEQKTVEKHD